MTAIIALFDSEARSGGMAADGCMSGHVNTRSRPKIRRVGRALIASSGALSGGQFLDEHCRTGLVLAGTDDLRDLAAKWRAWCVVRGHTEQEGGLRRYPSHFLILSPHGLFEICDDGEVLHHPPETRAAAIGIGAEVCMGAAHALRSSAYSQENSNGRHAAQIAVEAAIDLCDGCMAPVQVCVLEAPEPVGPEVISIDLLVMFIAANNVRRAIKECNEVGGQLAMACRSMLVEANLGAGAGAITAACREAERALPDDLQALAAVHGALLERAR